MDVGLCIGVCGDRRNYPFIETHAKDNWCMGYLDLIHLSIPSCDHRVVFKLKLKYKEYVVVKRLVIVFLVMFAFSVYSEDEKEVVK